MSPRAGVPQSRFEEQFDALPSTWLAQAGSGTETIQAYSDPQSGTPGNAYQAAGYRWREYPINILFDPNKVYRMRIRVRRTATSDVATQLVWCGFAGISADGVAYCNINGANQFGSQHYFVAGGFDLTTVPLNEWRIIEGYLQGRGPSRVGAAPNASAPGNLHKDAKYFRPLFIVNYNAGPAGNVTQIDYIVVDVMGDAGEFVHLIEVSFSGGVVRVHTGASTINTDLPDQLLGSDAAAQHAGQYEFTGFTESAPKSLAALGLAAGDLMSFSALVWNTTAGANERVRLKFWSAGPSLISTVDGNLINSTTPAVSKIERTVIPANATLVSARLVYAGTGAPQIQSARLVRAATFEAIGGNLQIGSVEESPDPGSQGIELQLSGVDQTIIAALLSNSFRGRVVKIWRAYLDSMTGQVLPDPLMLLEGLQLDPYQVTEDRSRKGGTVTVKTRIRGRMGVDRVRGIWASVTSHQHVYPGDTFFQNAASIGNTPIYWGVPKPISVGSGQGPHTDNGSGGGDQFIPG